MSHLCNLDLRLSISRPRPWCDRGRLYRQQHNQRRRLDVFPPTPNETLAVRKGKSMPWTNTVYNCAPALKKMVLVHPVFHSVYQGVPTSFYCLDVRPENLFLFLIYTGLTEFTTTLQYHHPPSSLTSPPLTNVPPFPVAVPDEVIPVVYAVAADALSARLTATKFDERCPQRTLFTRFFSTE
ncbi:hypothetical protein B0H14DRAFT_3427336 [Mycena olivaceomarginata]|nr:hypothetical protein B0H14DRAFT_3427336 [Mycena olivaceomarginata]